MIENICALEKIKKLPDNSQDIIYADPPYALGSTVLIGKDGKPYYKEARDFMNKWTMPDEKFWEEYMFHAHRVLKHGGRMLFFGIDRQLMLFQYYAVAAGLEIKQSLYWYFISNFPKATDLSKQVDKRLGAEREHIPNPLAKQQTSQKDTTGLNDKNGVDFISPNSSTELGKKYEGYKYSISPLKQVLETIMVFQKPTKYKSVLDDVFAFEEGDETISPSIWNIDDGRVGIREKPQYSGAKKPKQIAGGICYGDYNYDGGDKLPDGRYPPQMFIDPTCASKLDEQSGELTSGARKPQEQRVPKNENGIYNKGIGGAIADTAEKDTGGASRILHHIGYMDEELDLVIYAPKVSSFERELGCDGFEKQEKVFNGTGAESSDDMCGVEEKFTTTPTKNNHPTLKPIKLNYQIAKLLKTPFPQNVFFPFAGAWSEIIGFDQAGFDSKLFSGSEALSEFNETGKARYEVWKDLDINNLESSKKHIAKKSKENNNQGSLF